MRITGLTVSVDYADLLSVGLPRWRDNLAEVVVVTSASDEATGKAARQANVKLFVTEAFYRGGATFDKAGAISEAFASLIYPDWVLLFDADIVPPNDLAARLRMAEPQPGKLYGAPRYHEDGRMIPDRELAGYFQLFHASDQNAQRVPLLVSFKHAGGYDSEFERRWGRGNQVMLPIPLTHLGETGANWWGRGRTDLMDAMRAERRRRGGHRHERV